MATINALTSTLFNVVSVTNATKTIVVTGDATSQIAAGLRIRLAGTSATNGIYTVTIPAPIYAAGVTTFAVTTSPGTSAAVGTCNLVRNFATAGNWSGGVAPTTGDIAVIVANADIAQFSGSNNGNVTVESGGSCTFSGGSSSNNGNVTVESGGSCTFSGGGSNVGNVTVESGGSCTFSGSGSNNGNVTVESGGSCTFSGGSSSNNGNVTVESGGSCTFSGGSNYGNVTVESGGSCTFSGGGSNDANVTAYLYATVTGTTTTSLPVEKRTLHYTAGQSTDTLPLANGGKITLYDSVVVLGLLSPQVSSASIQAVASYKQNPYILIP